MTAAGLPLARRWQRPHNIINSLCPKPEQLEQKNFERFEKYRQVEAAEAMYESYCMEDATLCIVSFGITARVAKNAIAAARAQGIKVGMIRPITLWPFPKAPLCEAAKHCSAFLSVEMNMGQMLEDVQLAIGCSRPVYLCQPGRRHDPRAGAGAGENLRDRKDGRRKSMSVVFERPKALTNAPLHYCPGCTHGIIHRLVAEAHSDDVRASRAAPSASPPVGCSCYGL